MADVQLVVQLQLQLAEPLVVLHAVLSVAISTAEAVAIAAVLHVAVAAVCSVDSSVHSEAAVADAATKFVAQTAKYKKAWSIGPRFFCLPTRTISDLNHSPPLDATV